MESSPLTATLDDLCRAWADVHKFQGSVIVTRRDPANPSAKTEILLARGYGFANREFDVPNTPDCKYRIASNSKQFTCVVALRLIEDGRLEIDGTVDEYLNKNEEDPYFPREAAAKITLQHLMNQSTGLTDYVNLDDYEDTKHLPTKNGQRDIIDRIKNIPLRFEPGASFEFCDSNFVVLTHILETVTGLDISELMDVFCFKPAGLTSTLLEEDFASVKGLATGYNFDRRIGRSYGKTAQWRKCEYVLSMDTARGAGGLVSTVWDMEKWARAVIFAPKGQSPVLSEQSRDLLFQDPSQLLEYGPEAYYGCGLRRDSSPWGLFINTDGATEGFYSSHRAYLDSGIYLMILANTEMSNIKTFAWTLSRVAHGETLPEDGFPKSLKGIPATEADLQKFAGVYGEGGTLTLEVEGTSLLYKRHQIPGTNFSEHSSFQTRMYMIRELKPLDLKKGTFFAVENNFEYHFTVTDQGVENVSLRVGNRPVTIS
ncbi:beta-lactamase/transpeptidase-like protein [Fimicolochytrium jonesii]|uniref:beta-lactamase/transpeptidase-like protein n=1 Tax=Fimicolochytrium jonesii TaxID=1396493 RepID=UPI0022FEF218|nr:beta-lactamase/transpeptidase-like protein [Fimicolochytrium jonesii]KAI8815950.1 beta-lactamase/transpeptidase-like protein [Fimicolochytrium jonesii]